MLEPGRICIKTAGREKGFYCVVAEKLDDNFVIISGPKSLTGVRRRKCNVSHLNILQEKLDIPDKADDNVIESAWKTSNLLEKFNISLKPKKETLKEDRKELRKLPKQEVKKEPEKPVHKAEVKKVAEKKELEEK